MTMETLDLICGMIYYKHQQIGVVLDLFWMCVICFRMFFIFKVS